MITTTTFQTQLSVFRFTKARFAVKQATALCICVLLSFFASATVYNVTSTAESTTDLSTLRGAVINANASAGPHTINVAAGTYNLTGGQLTLGSVAGQNITIIGAGASNTIITQSASSRLLLFNPSGNVLNTVISISGVRFQNGVANNDNFAGGAILCGGPDNSVTLTNCEFINNTVSPSRRCVGGGVRCNGGGALIVSQCTFTSNSSPLPTNTGNNRFGGAIVFELTQTTGARNCNLSVTNSTFTGNTVGDDGSGGAIYIASGNQNTTTPNSFIVNVTENTFINNSVSGSNGNGGAIYALNAFTVNDNTFQIHHNRFIGNTAAIGSALVMGNSSAAVDASNNWWGCNDGPSVCADKVGRLTGSNTGAFTTSPHLQLRTTASGNNCTGGNTTITTSFTTNSAGTAIDATNLGAFAGVPVSFTASYGNISNAQTTIQANGTATATFTGTLAGTGTVNAVIDNVPSSDAAARASFTVNTTPSASSSGSTAICTGGTAILSATASGSGTLSYQWYKGATALSNGGNYSGVTTSTLTISNASASVAGTDYYVRVSSSTGCGPTNSGNATVAVNSSPVVNSQPVNTTVCAGTTTMFSVSASGNGTFNYQWFKGTTALSNGATGSGSTVAGATTPTITITNPGSSDAANYNVRITPSTGCAATTSGNAALTVNAAPTITSQTSAAGSCTGGTVILNVAASGSGTLSYQWYRGTTALTDGSTGTGSTISGATAA